MGKQNMATKPETVISLYPEGAPGSEHWHQEEQWSDIWWSDSKIIRNVSQPTLTVSLPDPASAKGTGVILCPGGGWHFLALQQEGYDLSRKLNAMGIAAFILKYRLVQTGEDYEKEVQRNMMVPDRMAKIMDTMRPLLLSDGQQAVRIVREHAAEWGVEPDRIGFAGFSAGGTVAINVALSHDDGCRPDFIAAVYTGHWEDMAVPEDAPAMFILCTADDEMASQNSLRLYKMWKNAGHPVEMHVYSKGGHGFCLRKMNLPVDNWMDRFIDWLQCQGFYAAD